MSVASILLLAAAAGQAGPAVPSSGHHWGSVFISPMGEPFRTDRGSDALAQWFARADRDHDGYVTLAEMQADAERFFGLLDTNHDGEIDPDEMTRYEQVVAPEVSSGAHFALAAGSGAYRQGRRYGGGDGRRARRSGGRNGGSNSGGSRDSSHQGASRFALLDLPEPVASADSDFNRGVSLAEFRQAAGERFIALDLDHHGRLTLAELESIRPAPAAQPNRQESADANPSDTDPR